MPLSSQKKIVELCRELRKNSTAAEKRLWANIRNRKVSQLKFVRQYPIIYASVNGLHSFFIVDFYCHEKRLAIEVDGEVHNEQQEYDEGRSNILDEMGIHVIRFTNDNVLSNTSQVLSEIRKAAE